MKKKKGEMTSGQIVSLIILIISFVVILLVFLANDWNQTIDSETCHQSVIYRASLHQLAKSATDYVPLKCKTEKICLTDGEECKEYGKDSRKNPVTTVKLEDNKDEAKKQILDSIANSLYECHTMMGEGEV